MGVGPAPILVLCQVHGFGTHHEAVAAPVAHVGALAVKDVAKGRVARVAGTAQHGILAVDLSRKQHAVAVVGQKSIFQLVKCLEIVGIAHADRRPVVAIAPGHIVPVLDPADAGVILVFERLQLGVVGDELDGLGLDLPIDAILAAAAVDPHLALFVVHAKDPGKSILKGHDGAVEDAVRVRDQIAGDDRVAAGSPHHIVTACGLSSHGMLGNMAPLVVAIRSLYPILVDSSPA